MLWAWASLFLAAGGYAVGPRDVLEIRVYEEPELSRDATVGQDGAIGYPLLGRVPVTGLTTVQIAEGLRSRLGAKYLVNPQVFVEVKEYNSRRALVLGAVKNPGAYALTGNTGVMELVARAGGVSDGGGRRIVVIHGGRSAEPLLLDAGRLFGTGDLTQNHEVRDGDLVFVPPADGIYVYGEVKKPGAVAYRSGLTLLQAVSLAEGLSNRAAAKRVQILRGPPGHARKLTVDLERAASHPGADLVLEPEDIVIVPASWF